MVADAVFEDPRLAAVYDDLDPDRSDLDLYASIIDEVEATSVLDVGCGTGTFAVRLVADGIQVVAVDPAQASLDVARAKPGAERVHWILGDARSLPTLAVDVATMTANVAQVFVTDAEWSATLIAIHAALRPGGVLVFESRIPSVRAWRSWNRNDSFFRTTIDRFGVVESWHELIDVDGDLVTFKSYVHFEATGDLIPSESTLRFRSRNQIEGSLHAAGFRDLEVRDAPDRPGRQYVFIAHRSG